MLTALMVLLSLLFVLVILWQCMKRGLLLPMMKKGWFSSFDLDVIADQLVLEITDHSKERRRQLEDSMVTLGSSPDSRDQSALNQSTETADPKADETL